ncbi:hypothetical protein [Mariniplasma anaerobium]|uniref:Uncharacterized protein n=1 Tax=Mariniplasma anaerobium TaxID=2735436 RepID=A0A7U9TI35_9MOLU|nr:hypothetical protein [Mariniplasma anaerobium]BCR35619.1 hypothetical protein MPAN_005120 [Mariniplasma anaerobium]
MSIQQQFQEPYNKYDLIDVIKQGFFMAIVGGLLIGSLQLLIAYSFNISLTWLMLIILASLTAKRIKQASSSPHIIFSIISVVSFVFAYYLMNVTSNVGLIYLFTGTIDFNLVIEVLNPLPFFNFLNPLNSLFFKVNNIIDIVFFIISVYYAYKHSK